MSESINTIITSLDLQIKLMEELMNTLKATYDDNNTIINELKPRIGKKRKRCETA